jgi:hypothetical protein
LLTVYIVTRVSYSGGPRAGRVDRPLPSVGQSEGWVILYRS